jgi:hypothetical protein
MEGDRSQRVMARIEAALARIDVASANFASNPAPSAASNVTSLVNKHEALREEVAATMRDLDKLIAEIEG